MKNSRRTLVRFILFVTLPVFLAFATVESVSAQTQLQKTINRYLAGVAKVSNASEYREAKIAYGDLDGDGDKDVVVQFVLEGLGGGNSWDQSIAVFRNDNGIYKAVTDETVGGKFYRIFELKEIVNRKIIGTTETCPEAYPQGMCQRPKRGQATYILQNGKLSEK